MNWSVRDLWGGNFIIDIFQGQTLGEKGREGQVGRRGPAPPDAFFIRGEDIIILGERIENYVQKGGRDSRIKGIRERKKGN